MTNDETTNKLRAQLVEPLNKLLDAKPRLNAYLDYSVIPDIERLAYKLRDDKLGELVAEVMMPLYREVLFNPSERMVENVSQDEAYYRFKWARSQVTETLQRLLNSETYLGHLFDGIDMIDAVEHCIVASESFRYNKRLFLYSLAAAILDGYTTNWDELYYRINPELTNIPKNCNRSKIEYCCMLKSVIMIMRNGALPFDEKKVLLTLLVTNRTWNEVFAYLYSVLLGVMLNPSFDNNLQIMRLFAGNRYKYAHLLCACIDMKPDICLAPESQKYKQRRYNEAYKRLVEEASSYQNDVLDKLFAVIFPKATVREYVKDSARLTAAEMERKYDELNTKYLQLCEKMENVSGESNEVMESQSITIDELKQGFDDMTLDCAEKFYSLLDDALTENERWLRRKKEFKDALKIKQKKQNEENIRCMMKYSDSFSKNSIVIEQLNLVNGDQVAHKDANIDKNFGPISCTE